MDKQKARQLYELADRLSKLDVNTLSEEQQQQRSTMIAKLQEEAQGVKEEFNGEYDDEAGMVQSNLRTMARAVNGLLDTIEDNDNLPEWAQEKIAKAEMMTTSVWDYLLSQKEQGMDPKVTEAEDKPRFDPLVAEIAAKMQGPTKDDAIAALITVLGTRAYAERPGFYSLWLRQAIDKYNQQGLAEAGFPGAPDVEMPPMKPSGDPQRDKLKQEYMDLHREIKSLVDIPYRSDSSPEQKMQAKARIKQLNDRADQIKAILEPRQPPNEWQKKTYGYDDNWNIVKKGVAEGYDPVESDYQQWEDILVKDGYRGDPSGAYALELVVGHQLMSDPAEVASTIRNILTYVKQNRQVLGKAVSDRKTVKDAIIDIKNKFPQQYQAAQQPQGVAETKKPSPKLTAVDIKKTAPVSEEINTEAYERLQKVFAFKNYES